jgi:hypothetical protein
MYKLPQLIGLFFIFGMFQSIAYAQYYRTLPKGVRSFVYRNYQTSEISSSYNHSKNEIPYGYEINANAAALDGIENETIQSVLDLYRAYPNAFNALSLGTYKIAARAQVNVDAYGLAYGVTDRLSVYFGVPIYKANVNIDYRRKAGNNYQQVADILQQYTTDDWAQTMGNITEQLPDLDGHTIQSLIVNNFGYDQIGSWEGEGAGDTEFGMIYNFYNDGKLGASTWLGGVAPTGYVDDPDILQDIGFGDGQWDAFVEVGAGYTVNKWLTLNTWGRYTYQFPTEKELRIPFTESFAISDETGTFTEKLGDKMDFAFYGTFTINDWLSVTPTYLYTHNEIAQYDSPYGIANELLGQNTESVSHSMRLSMDVTSVNLFSKGSFPIPLTATFSYLKMIEGRNIPKVDRLEFEFKMFF